MKILIADDELTSRILLHEILEADGYSCVVAEDGTQAWDILQQDGAPQLVLLDWMMPGLDGVDVCRRLRGRQNAAGYTYVLMLTAKGERADIEAGYAAGVDDYLTKPVNGGELRQRLRVARRILEYEQQQVAARQQLETFASEMQDLAEARARQLVNADRLVTLGMLSASIAHEINNPIGYISGNAKMMEQGWARIAPHVDAGGADDQARFMLEAYPSMIAGILEGGERIARIVDGLKRYARQVPATRSPFALRKAVEAAQMICHSAIKHHVQVAINLPDDLPAVCGDFQQIEQILINCMTNAGQALEGRKDGRIVVTAQVGEDGRVEVRIADNGPGIPEEYLVRIFDPFFTTKDEGKGTGLGLSVSKGIAESHGGDLVARNVPGGGAEFTFTLPVAGEPPALGGT